MACDRGSYNIPERHRGTTPRLPLDRKFAISQLLTSFLPPEGGAKATGSQEVRGLDTLVFPFPCPFSCPWPYHCMSRIAVPVPPGEVRVGHYCNAYPLLWTGRAMSPADRPWGLVGGQGACPLCFTMLDVFILVGLSLRRHCEG